MRFEVIAHTKGDSFQTEIEGIPAYKQALKDLYDNGYDSLTVYSFKDTGFYKRVRYVRKDGEGFVLIKKR